MHTIPKNSAGHAADDGLNAAFAALADPTRRAILSRLALGETSVGDLIKPFPISGPAISRHLRVLENARLIDVLEQGEGHSPAPPRSTAPGPRAARKPGVRHARNNNKLVSPRKRKSP